MRARFAVAVILALFAGCSKSNGPQINTVAPDAFEKPPAPEPEEKGDDDATVDERESEVLTKKPVEGKLTVPADGGEWPIVAARVVKAQPVSLTRILKQDMHVRSAAVNPASGRAIALV